MVYQAFNYLTYPGDKTGMVGQVKGPTTLDEFWIAVSAKYDEQQDTSSVKFRLMTAQELEEKFSERFETEVSS